MSSISRDLESFLDVVDKVARTAAEGPASSVSSVLASAGLLTLGRDTLAEEDGLQWLTHTVRVTAQSSPSLAFVLAARFTADRALGAQNRANEPTFGLPSHGSSAVAATALEPDTLVVLDVLAATVTFARWTDIAASAVHQERSGLGQARLVSVPVNECEPLPAGDAATAMTHWDLLTGAALLGLAQRAVRATQTYVQERHQFGAPIGSFAGLRALVGDMDLKCTCLQALLDSCTDGSAPSEALSTFAGRAATEICIDAIQAHGGYGYIDEYPVAGLLRDAISLQARAGGRRLHLARLAQQGLGPVHSGRS